MVKCYLHVIDEQLVMLCCVKEAFQKQKFQVTPRAIQTGVSWLGILFEGIKKSV
jgi:hypothetical protein